MGQSVKLADDVMELVRQESGLQSRSVAGQITHWLKIGRAIEQSSAFDYARIRAALNSAVSPDDLTGEEQEVWAADFAEQMAQPVETERAALNARKVLGQGVGLANDGSLVYQDAEG